MAQSDENRAQLGENRVQSDENIVQSREHRIHFGEKKGPFGQIMVQSGEIMFQSEKHVLTAWPPMNDEAAASGKLHTIRSWILNEQAAPLFCAPLCAIGSIASPIRQLV